MTSLESVSSVSVFSVIPCNIYYSTRVYQTSKVVKTLWCSDGLMGHISSLESVSLVSVFSGLPRNIYYTVSESIKQVKASREYDAPMI